MNEGKSITNVAIIFSGSSRAALCFFGNGGQHYSIPIPKYGIKYKPKKMHTAACRKNVMTSNNTS